jgi:glycosyltransferase involved in cell wall biosynthesis
LQSLVDQTLQDIEIICVNDGSTDGTGKKLDKWQTQYPDKIKIIHQQNGGPSKARNVGMSIAQGEYIGFVDADDWVDITMFAKLYNTAASTKSEVVHCERCLYHQQTHKYITKKWKLPTSKISSIKKIAYIQTYANGREGACFFIFLTTFLKQKNITFIKHFSTFEDFPFLLKVCLQANKISNVNEILYYYRQKHTSNRVSKAQNTRAFMYLKVFKHVKNFLEEDNTQTVNHLTMVQILSHAYAIKGINKRLLCNYLIQASYDIFSYNKIFAIYKVCWLLTKHKNFCYLPFTILLNLCYFFCNRCHK